MPKRCTKGKITNGKDATVSGNTRTVLQNTCPHTKKGYGKVKRKLDAVDKLDDITKKPLCSTKTFSEVAILWLSSVKIKLKQSTVYRYEYLIERHILPVLGRLNMDKINSATVNAFLEEKLNGGKLNGKGGLSSSYVTAIANVVKMIISFAVSEELCPPIKAKISRPMQEKSEILVISEKQQAQLKAHIDQKMDLTGIGIMISLYAGLRIGEVLALRWGDVDLKEEIIHVRHTVARVKFTDKLGKSGTQLILDKPKTHASQRDIPIASTLLPYLVAAKEMVRYSFVISDSERFLSPRTFEYRYHRIMRQSIGEDINFHALRHTFATRCVEKGVDIKSLSEILGHSNVSITLNTYVHSSIEQKRKQLEKLSV